MPRDLSFTDQVLTFLTLRPHQWVSADVLATIGGKYAWRTRVSDARHLLQANRLGTIENRQTRHYDDDGELRHTTSEYRFVPTPPPANVNAESLQAQGGRLF